MKAIKLLRKFKTTYSRIFIGDQEEIVDTPFRIHAGTLTRDGEVENGDPKYRRVDGDRFALVANTNSQVVLTAKNKYHRKALLILKATASTTSWDWVIKVGVKVPGTTAVQIRPLKNGKGGDLYFANAIASSGAVFELLADLPYGDDIDIIVSMDNNHLSTVITVDSAILFFDPVR